MSPRSIYSTIFFSSRRRHTMFDCDWSSDVCSSDLARLRDRRYHNIRGDGRKELQGFRLDAGGRIEIIYDSLHTAPFGIRRYDFSKKGNDEDHGREGPEKVMKKRGLTDSFNYAIDGLKHALKTQRNMRIHFIIGAGVIAAGLIVSLPPVEFILLLG